MSSVVSFWPGPIHAGDKIPHMAQVPVLEALDVAVQA